MLAPHDSQLRLSRSDNQGRWRHRCAGTTFVLRFKFKRAPSRPLYSAVFRAELLLRSRRKRSGLVWDCGDLAALNPCAPLCTKRHCPCLPDCGVCGGPNRLVTELVWPLAGDGRKGPAPRAPGVASDRPGCSHGEFGNYRCFSCRRPTAASQPATAVGGVPGACHPGRHRCRSSIT